MPAQKYKKGQMIKASYWTAVYKKAIPGWRDERVEAVLEVQSPGKAKVVAASMEKAGSKRQQYNTTGSGDARDR